MELIKRTIVKFAIFRKKSILNKNSELKKCFTALDLALLGIGAIIGTGIFVLTGIVAAYQAGPGVVLSFIVAGITCGFAALAYSELASSVGGCGSAYGYTYVAFGEIFAWIIGWILLLEYGVAVATVANGWSGYFLNILGSFGVNLPHSLTNAPSQGGIINLPATIIVLLLMGLLMMGSKESARLNAAMVFVKLLTIAVFIAIAAFHIEPDNWTPFLPFGWFSSTADGGTIGVLAGASLVFFAYIGFDAVSTAVEEAKNPSRDIPIGILASLFFCSLVYIIVSGLLTGVVPYQELGNDFPVAYALNSLGFKWASALISTGIISGLTTVMLVLYYGLTRILYAMSRDGLLPVFFSTVNAKTQTPIKIIFICGVIMAFGAGLFPLGALAELVNIGTLSAFILVCFGVVLLRIQKPDMPRPFRVPFGLLLPVLGVLSCGALILFLPSQTWMRFLFWNLLGLIIYFAYSFRNSQLNRT